MALMEPKLMVTLLESAAVEHTTGDVGGRGDADWHVLGPSSQLDKSTTSAVFLG